MQTMPNYAERSSNSPEGDVEGLKQQRQHINRLGAANLKYAGYTFYGDDVLKTNTSAIQAEAAITQQIASEPYVGAPASDLSIETAPTTSSNNPLIETNPDTTTSTGTAQNLDANAALRSAYAIHDNVLRG